MILAVLAVFAPALTAPAAASAAAPVFNISGKEVTSVHEPVLLYGELGIDSPVLGEVKCATQLYGEVWNQLVGGETRGVAEVDGLTASKCSAPELLEPLEAAGQRPSVVVIAEGPLQEKPVEAEVCAAGNGPPGSCAEKQTVSLVSSVRRAPASVPWKAELVRGEREGEPVVLARLGIHGFGETAGANDAQTGVGTCYPKQGSAPAGWAAVPPGCMLLTIVVPQIPVEYVLYGSQEIEWINGSKNGLFPSESLFEDAGQLSSSEGQAGEVSTVEGDPKLVGTNNVELVRVK